eukprot:m.61324 g.61324  ORF g.61324 m.61324 type:complete len:169 (-) comp13713_c0_seq1:477-983(-)
MSCAALKRPCDLGENPEPMAFNLHESPYNKRTRMMPPPDGYLASPSPRRANPESVFQPKSMPDSVDAIMSDAKRRRHMRPMEPVASGVRDCGVCEFCGNKPSKNSDLFTSEQVKAIVERAVKEREIQLQAEYDEVLGERLQEQFNMFSKFNEDHIHRQLSQSTHMYMS